MIGFALAHAPLAGAGFLGYIAGLIRAAHCELRREKLDRWLEVQRRVNASP